jgi:glucokinase
MRVAGVADIGGTHTRVGLVGEDYSFIRFQQVDTPVSADPSDVTSLICDILADQIFACPGIRIEGIGVSGAGPVDLKNGIIVNPPNMQYESVPVVEPLSGRFGCPVLLMNDCRAAVMGEVYAGAGRGYGTIVYITFSTGIGGGIFENGTVLTGRGGNAGEIGHFYVDTGYQQRCSCQGTGHWEGYASGRGIPAFFQNWCKHEGIIPGFPCSSAEEILDAAARGDREAVRFVRVLATINARGLSTVIVAYDPDIIILDGPVITCHPELILTPAFHHIDRYLPLPKFRISPLGGKAPLLGVAAAVFSRSVSGLTCITKGEMPDNEH